MGKEPGLRVSHSALPFLRASAAPRERFCWLHTRAAKWQNLAQTRHSFPHADQITVKSGRTVTVFNITNHFRLITAIHYNRQEVFALRFLTHADYDKDTWKHTL